jgi:hypothetical protein
MSLVVFQKTASGPSFGPYNPGDVVDLSAGDITKLTVAAALNTDPIPPGVTLVPTDQTGTL